MTGHPQILPKLSQSLSGLLSFLAATLARKYIVHPPSLQVLPSFCTTSKRNVAHVFEP